jgi:hypothetical protein
MPVCLLAASVIVRGLERVDHGVEQAKQLERDEDCDLIELDDDMPALVSGEIDDLLSEAWLHLSH